MLATLIRLSAAHRAVVLLLAGSLLALAGWLLPRQSVDVFPELNAPTVVVLTECGGLAAEESEAQVTRPIEAALAGVPGLRRLRSASSLSLSIVWAEFEWGMDVRRARTDVSERLASVREILPAQAHPELAPITSITGEILLLSLTGRASTAAAAADALALRGFAEFELRQHLLAVPGVAQVVAIGGALPEYQVHVRQAALSAYGLSLTEIAAAAGGAHSTAAAGYLPDVEARELAIRQSAQVRSVDDLRATLICIRDGKPVTLGDVADISLGGAPARGAAAEADRSAVIISVQKAPGTNTLALTQRVDAALDRLPLLPGMALNRAVFRQADFIQRSVDTLTRVLRDAGIIVAVVLALFLMNLRTTLITLIALPLSLAGGILVLAALGLSLNVMTLGGLAVAIGGLVDDAIIFVENAWTRIRQDPTAARTSLARVVVVACIEIQRPMVYATAVIVLVFAPLLFLGGLEGRFFVPLGIAYIVSTLASLVVALTVTPALCALLLRPKAPPRDVAHRDSAAHRDGILLRALHALYQPALRAALRWRAAVLVCAGLLTAASLWLGSTFGSSFLPTFREGTFTVFLIAPPGTSLTESDRLARGVEARIAAMPEVRSIARRTGRAERDEHAEPVSSSEMEVTLKQNVDAEAVRRAIQGVLAAVPGLTTMIGQPIEHRLSHVMSGTPAALAIDLFGEDLDVLRARAQDVAAAVRGVAGTREVNANREILIDALPIAYRHGDLARAGLTPAAAAEQVRIAIAGERVATVADGLRRLDIAVRLHHDDRATPEALRELILIGASGARVRLREVADIGRERQSALIAHEGGRRKATVSCNIAADANLGHVVAAVRTLVDPIAAQHGLAVQYGGQFAAQQDASRTIFWLGLVAVIAIFLLVRAATASSRIALLVLLNLPLALIGGIAAIFIADSPSVVGNLAALLGFGSTSYVAPVVSIASLVGFITLFGIAVRNGILLVGRYREHRAAGLSLDDAILAGSRDRLAAILMTALSAALGLVPLAYTAGQPGSEILAPLAIVVLGGLATSTALNLLVVPAAYRLCCGGMRMEAPKAEK